MTLIPKYRATAVFLGLIFSLFNLGLPIVVASCPMMKYENAKSCIMCDDGAASGVSIKRTVDTSCCATKFTPGRNTNEFLQTVQNGIDGVKSIVPVVLTGTVQLVISDSRVLVSTDTSPPVVRDIPILVSSLLI